MPRMTDEQLAAHRRRVKSARVVKLLGERESAPEPPAAPPAPAIKDPALARLAGEVAALTDLHAVAEHRFHASRRWRFDFALVPLGIALEVDGGVWTGGRHVRPKGFLRDTEKLNEASLSGWIVLRVTPQQVVDGTALSLVLRAIEMRRRAADA